MLLLHSRCYKTSIIKALKANSALKYVTDANAEFYYKKNATTGNQNAFAFAADGEIFDLLVLHQSG